MPWPQTGAAQYHAQLGLPDKGRANNWLGLEPFGPAKQSSPGLLSRYDSYWSGDILGDEIF